MNRVKEPPASLIAVRRAVEEQGLHSSVKPEALLRVRSVGRENLRIGLQRQRIVKMLSHAHLVHPEGLKSAWIAALEKGQSPRMTRTTIEARLEQLKELGIVKVSGQHYALSSKLVRKRKQN